GGMICGNGVVEGSEQCDDGNEVDDDGCTRECEFTCTENIHCADDDVCDGAEVCNTETHTCEEGTPAADGTACETETGVVCFMGGCITPECGNSVVEPGEQCDDGMNGDDDDGCTDACEVTCTTEADCSHLDGQCTVGACVDNLCVSEPANEGNSCDDGMACTTGETCGGGTCGGGAPVDCSSEDSECTVGVCDETDGSCVAMP